MKIWWVVQRPGQSHTGYLPAWLQLQRGIVSQEAWHTLYQEVEGDTTIF